MKYNDYAWMLLEQERVRISNLRTFEYSSTKMYKIYTRQLTSILDAQMLLEEVLKEQ